MARTLHEIFETEYAPFKGEMKWHDWWAERWGTQIETYKKRGWATIPIGVRSKLPVRAASNYTSHGAKGPFLTADQALQWIQNDFNLAVVAGPSKIEWCDMDNPELLRDFMRQGLLMQTPRGYALPFTKDRTCTVAKRRTLEKLGYEFRIGASYELVPLSQTCLHDHGLHSRLHPKPSERCVGGGRHEFRVREWITPLDFPVLSFKELFEGVTLKRG